jgi:hypothetical protein
VWLNYLFTIDRGRMADRITIFGTGRYEWSSTCSAFTG